MITHAIPSKSKMTPCPSRTIFSPGDMVCGPGNVMGIVVRIDENQRARSPIPGYQDVLFPYLVLFSDNELDWMQEDFLEAISGDR